jgi:hypothetical protein
LNRFAILIVILGLPLNATVVTFTGLDGSAGPGDPRPNSDGAFSVFLADASSLGTQNLETFESATAGDFVTLPLSFFTITSGGGNADPDISNVQDGSEGFNTTSGGQWFLHFWENAVGEPEIFLTFSFPTPIFAFGAYFTGVGTSLGTTTLEFNDGSSQVLTLPESSLQNVQFYGFTSTVAFSQLTLRISPESLSNADQIGVDDIYTFSQVPEPGTWALMAAGLGLVGGISRRRSRRTH